jgi:hypothetical protein
MYNPFAATGGGGSVGPTGHQHSAASHNNGVGGVYGDDIQPSSQSQHPYFQHQQQLNFINPVSYSL